MAYAQSKDQLCFVQVETAFGTIPNASGVATLANTNACLVTALHLNGNQTYIDRPDKTGTLSSVIGSAGRRTASWDMSCSLAGSGTAGTPPDIAAFLQALFGQAATVSAGVSTTFSLADLTPSLSIFGYRTPSSVNQQIALGSIVDQAVFKLGNDVASVDFTGSSLWVLDTDQFSTADTVAKGGLTAFPSEPSSPVTNGTFAVGFRGVITLDGNSYASQVRTATITFKANRSIPNDVIGANGYGANPGQDTRAVSVQWSMYDDDTANLKSLRLKATNGTPFDATLQVGGVAGNIWTFTLKNIVCNAPQYDDSQRRYVVNFSGKANASSLTAKDELALVIT